MTHATATPQAVRTHALAPGVRACPSCGRPARRLHRVRFAGDPGWVASCALCAAGFLERSAATVYGGMLEVGARLRRRAG